MNIVVKVSAELVHDSYNSFPGEITFERNGTYVDITLDSGDRKLCLKMDDFMGIAKAFQVMHGADRQ